MRAQKMFLGGALLFLLIWATAIISFGPPKSVIISQNMKIPSIQGSYCWYTFLNDKCVDKVHPVELVEIKDLKPIILSPQSEIEVKFKQKPLEAIEVTSWSTSQDILEVNLIKQSNTIVAPQNEGIYIYAVTSRWDNGSTSDIFAIEVRN